MTHCEHRGGLGRGPFDSGPTLVGDVRPKLGRVRKREMWPRARANSAAPNSVVFEYLGTKRGRFEAKLGRLQATISAALSTPRQCKLMVCIGRRSNRKSVVFGRPWSFRRRPWKPSMPVPPIRSHIFKIAGFGGTPTTECFNKHKRNEGERARACHVCLLALCRFERNSPYSMRRDAVSQRFGPSDEIGRGTACHEWGSLDFGRTLVDSWPILVEAEFGPTLVDIGPCRVDSRPNLIEFGRGRPNLADIGPWLTKCYPPILGCHVFRDLGSNRSDLGIRCCHVWSPWELATHQQGRLHRRTFLRRDVWLLRFLSSRRLANSSLSAL